MMAALPTPTSMNCGLKSFEGMAAEYFSARRNFRKVT
jgi:hypothetical protein